VFCPAVSDYLPVRARLSHFLRKRVAVRYRDRRIVCSSEYQQFRLDSPWDGAIAGLEAAVKGDNASEWRAVAR
jgi:hypothetical protein